MPRSAPTLRPVAEAYHFRDNPPPWAWLTTEPGTFTQLFLSDETTPAEVGAIIATEVYHLQLELGPTAAEWLDPLLASGPLSLTGGVVASDGENEVRPVCCCSVISWREWQRFATDGSSPWMGHDPTGWAEWVGDVARVWPNGGYTKTREGDPVEFARERFVSQLVRVECDLMGFLDRVEEWAATVGYDNPPAVRRAFAESVLREPTECGSPSPPG